MASLLETDALVWNAAEILKMDPATDKVSLPLLQTLTSGDKTSPQSSQSQKACTPRSRSDLPGLASPRTRKPLLSPKRLIDFQRRGLGEESGLDTSTKNHDSELEQLRVQNERLRQELQSLRDMYAKHTAYTELKCDRLLREKDQECTDWYKERKLEIKKMQSAVVIMHSFFEKKRRRLLVEMESDRLARSGREEELQQQVSEMKITHERERQQLSEELEEHLERHQVELAELQQEKARMDGKVANLEQILDESRRDQERLREENRQQTKNLMNAKEKLAQVEKNADLDRGDQQIAALEAELQSTRRTMKEGWKKDVDQLRQELMDYVRFIVHILPENWTETEAFDKAPAELREQLSWTGGPKSGKVRGSTRGKTPGGGQTSRSLAGTLRRSDAILKRIIS